MLCVVRSVLDILNIFGMEMIARRRRRRRIFTLYTIWFQGRFPSAELLIAVIQIPPL